MRLAAAVLISSIALAQEPVAAPRAGIVLQPNGHLRVLRGVPGAAYVAPTNDSSVYSVLSSASHAPVSVAIDANDHAWLLANGSTLELPERNITAVSISPRGTFFAVLVGEALQVYASGSPQQPRRVYKLPNLGIPNVAPAILAVSDTGTAVIATKDHVACAEIDGGIAYASLALTHIRFAPQESKTVVAFSSRDEALVQVHLPAFAIEPLTGRQDRITDPTGLEFSRDARSLWISQPSGFPTVQYVLETRSLTEHLLPTGRLVSIGTPGVYQWTAETLLDTTRSLPAVFLIPTRSQEDK